MTALEHLEEIQEGCLAQKDGCAHCPCHDGELCIWKQVLNTAPYEWNLKALEGVLYGY